MFLKIIIPDDENIPFLNTTNVDNKGYESASKNQRKWLIDGNTQFPNSIQVAKVTFTAVTDEKDKIHYPTDSVSQKL